MLKVKVNNFLTKENWRKSCSKILVKLTTIVNTLGGEVALKLLVKLTKARVGRVGRLVDLIYTFL